MPELPFISAAEAVQAVRSGDHIHLSSIASVPHILIEALCERAHELSNLHFHHFHTEGPAPYSEERYKGPPERIAGDVPHWRTSLRRCHGSGFRAGGRDGVPGYIGGLLHRRAGSGP